MGLAAALVLWADAALADEPAAPPAPARPGADLGGLRPTVAAAQLEFGLTYTGEALGVAAGGVKRGDVFDGQVGMPRDADLDKLFSWPGATLHVNAIAIHGRGALADLVGNLMTVSNMKAQPTVRLYTLWLEPAFLDGRLSVRAARPDDVLTLGVAYGRISADAAQADCAAGPPPAALSAMRCCSASGQ